MGCIRVRVTHFSSSQHLLAQFFIFFCFTFFFAWLGVSFRFFFFCLNGIVRFKTVHWVVVCISSMSFAVNRVNRVWIWMANWVLFLLAFIFISIRRFATQPNPVTAGSLNHRFDNNIYTDYRSQSNRIYSSSAVLVLITLGVSVCLCATVRVSNANLASTNWHPFETESHIYLFNWFWFGHNCFGDHSVCV